MSAPEPTRKLLFVDGMRGLLALIVVVYHITETVTPAHWRALPAGVRRLLEWVHDGSGDRVAMFTALSGFCLMLSVLADPTHAIRGGVGGFVLRRARRILPAYYAAIALALLILWRTHQRGGLDREAWLDHAAPSKVLSHALLVHNLWEDHIGALIWPVWNLAVEWQLYLLFCLVLVPLWRRCGGLARPVPAASALLGLCALVGLLSLWLPPADESVARTLRASCPWLALPFAVGMVGAAAVHRRRQAAPAGWGRAALVVGLTLAGLRLFADPPRSVGYLLAGLLCTLVLGGCLAASGPRRWARRALEARPLVWLGACSYSVYLTHALVLPRVDAAALRLLPEALWPLSWPLQLVAAIVFGQLFYRCVERPASLGGSAA